MRSLVAVLTALSLVASPSLAAADPWKDESGQGLGYEARGPYHGKKRRGPPAHAGPPDRGHPARHERAHARRGRGYLDAGRCNREAIGRILGAAAGAAAGSQLGDGDERIYAIIGGAIAGVLLGGEIGRAMDRADRLCVDQVLENAPTGRTVGWENPDTHRRHRVTPRETYRTETGRYCREYTAQSTIGGEVVQTYGTACRQADGAWKIVSRKQR